MQPLAGFLLACKGEELGMSTDISASISEYFFVDSWFLGGVKSIFDTQD